MKMEINFHAQVFHIQLKTSWADNAFLAGCAALVDHF